MSSKEERVKRAKVAEGKVKRAYNRKPVVNPNEPDIDELEDALEGHNNFRAGMEETVQPIENEPSVF